MSTPTTSLTGLSKLKLTLLQYSSRGLLNYADSPLISPLVGGYLMRSDGGIHQWRAATCRLGKTQRRKTERSTDTNSHTKQSNTDTAQSGRHNPGQFKSNSSIYQRSASVLLPLNQHVSKPSFFFYSIYVHETYNDNSL